MKVYLLYLSMFFYSVCFAQNKVSGLVSTVDNKSIPDVTISIKGTSTGAVSDASGNFVLNSTKPLPWEIKLSRVGYETQEVYVTSANEKLTVFLIAELTRLNEIVISASRTPERLLESPVTIERMGIADIKKSASPTFYEGLENMKEVQMNTSSLTFKSINTRGFASVANTRFMQLVDGMDNSSPLLNFVLGNMIGVSEIDVLSVELLPGASSALYGANAFNGILFMNSKSPFVSQGITGYVKYGLTSQKAAGTNDYADYGVRLAKAFNPYIAAKANITYLKGTDWYATNYDDKTVANGNRTNPGYDGINVYGDEASTDLKGVADGLLAAGKIDAAKYTLVKGILPSETVSRTGYNETDLTDNKASNTKLDASVHIRPFGDERLEVILQSKLGFGNAVYQGANRYYLNNFMMQQHKIEFKGKNFFVRGYTTTEDGGQSYDMVFTGINVNRKWKDDNTWFGEYAGAYVTSTLDGKNSAEAHKAARDFADIGRLLPGTTGFKQAFDEVIGEGDVLKGSKLIDNSRIYHSDANYNFKDLIKFAEIQVGGSFRSYNLNSHGRIYTDANGPILYSEYGAYTQLTKKMLDDRLKFTGSMRYDKSQNFNGNVSPRLSLVYTGGESRNHNFRASFQTGFRNPSTQDQYIGFNVGKAVLLGSAPDNLTRYSEVLSVKTTTGQVLAGGQTVTVNGENAYYNSYTEASINSFKSTGDVTMLKKANANLVKPEVVKAFELGYRSVVAQTSIDISGYYNIYNDFIGNLNVVAPLYGTAQDGATGTEGAKTLHALQNSNYRAFQLYTNAAPEIKSLGFGIGLSRKVYQNFELGANYNYAEFNFDQASDPSFEAGFNTPKHRVKVSLGNEKITKKLGFNISGRWNTSYLWQSSFVDGMVAGATVVDAQVNYKLPFLNSILKVGATNIGSNEYSQVLGAGLIGQQYFASLTINP